MDISNDLQRQLEEAIGSDTKLAVSGGHSKDFYGRQVSGDEFSMAGHTGIVEYDPRELVITARAGTTLKELKQVLSDSGQMLPFEPPAFGEKATLGGTLACGFSGPRRPYLGSARDFVLGTQIFNGKAELLTFGGQVMKNVAGYDLSRMMVGALGTLGVILQASMKVLPKPEVEMTTVLEMPVDQAIEVMNKLAGRNVPLSAAAYFENKLYLRFSSVESSVSQAIASVGGSQLDNDAQFWQQLTEQQHDFFKTDKTLWRLSVPPATPELNLDGATLYEWGGAQRWFISNNDQLDAQSVQGVVSLAGGHAAQFRNGERQSDVFHHLPDTLMKLHQQLKNSMDPAAVFNPGRLYKAF